MTEAPEPDGEDGAPPPGGSPQSPVRRGRWIAGWSLGTVGLTVLAFGLGTLVRSPWETAAENAARTPTTTTTVQMRQFTADEVVATGTVSAGTLTTIRGSAAGDDEAVVTATPLSAGAQVAPGSVLVEISGRPVIALPLPFLLYRDLVPGDSGTDVRALQQTLADLGLYTSQVDGAYGPGTAAAVRALYAGTSATAPAPAADLVEAVEAARAALGEAQAAVASAERDLDRARRAQGQGAAEQGTGDSDAETRSAVAEAEAALNQARGAAAAAQTALSAAEAAADTSLPRAETAPVAAGTSTLVRVAPLGTVLGGSADGEGAQAGGAGGAAQVRSGAPSASVRVSVADAAHLTPGTTVSVTSVRDSTRSATGTVAEVGEFGTTSAQGEMPGYDVTIGFPETDDLVLDDGESITATPAEGATTQEGLAVPLVAVRSEDGRTHVLVAGPGDPTRVEVEVVTTGAGYALVSTDRLSAGDVVVIDGAS